MSDLSYLGNGDLSAINDLYEKYKANPESVDESWFKFFQGFEFATKNFAEADSASEIFDVEFKVLNLIEGYRKRGHLFTVTNPVRSRRKYFPTLDAENYDLSADLLDKEFFAGKEIGIGKASLRDIIKLLEKIYCGPIGSEFMFIRNPEKLKWLKDKIEKNANTSFFSAEEKKELYSHLVHAVGFENFIHKKFTGQKRFSLEGAEIIVPGLREAIDFGAEMGVEEFSISMAHRGRLNILANILQKPYERIFKEFEGEAFEEKIDLGDVKYHLGYGNVITTTQGKKVTLNLVPNPSHLESATPVIEGVARARIDGKYNGDSSKLVPIIIHGDAAISAQGVVYEVVQMADLNGYKTGGSIHLVINNQIGFTTNYLDGRSSTYSTDIGKVTKSPIFHVNGDDVEALAHTLRLAIEYRQTFKSDVFIDILSYRKYGHNEGDEPRFTQPLLYKAIATHPNPRDIYAKRLLSEGVYSEEQLNEIVEDFDNILDGKLSEARKLKKVIIPQFLKSEWEDLKYSDPEDFEKKVKTGVSKKELLRLAKAINHLPEKKIFFKKIVKLLEDRLKFAEDNKVDWAMGELLAYATLLEENHNVRISGQDSVRGTFSHRHASMIIEDTDQVYTPLQNISEKQGKFTIYNSHLSEYGVLGFEYGYALATPQALTIWEAQFGDFANVAQVIVDQYISSAEEKWGLMNGLVLFLPHGFEGQGPEHSSARMERYLALSAKGNMQIVNPTTPANLFHLLRLQLKRNFRVPIVVFTPKSLLRHPLCISTLDELQNNFFQPVIDDNDVTISEVRRIVFCTGKIYYDLLAKKTEFEAKDIAVIRIEQLHPFPIAEVAEIIKKYKNNLLSLWVQEEPENMGAWYYIQNAMKKYNLVPVTRQPSGSTAVGLFKIHEMQQQEILSKVFRRCDCALKNKYCGLQCVVGSSRKEVLKQHYYFDNLRMKEE
ncbi:MAG: 2-oxoglutarate dehydrogenase E1 component [Bacteroidales bacterium]|nr:2-oxoglutarate dehydrogenase E1 component [Bacteroidales bacterium]MCF8391355.1 2-oxoglutarate dehydrogenase E1 component [Bacteroidales bacterium]